MNKILFLLWILSPFGIYSIGRKQQKPCDESNRINKIILLWFVFTRKEQLNKKLRVPLSSFKLVMAATFNEKHFIKACPWLSSDMWERLY